MISLLFALLFTFNLYSAGFTGDTLLLTKDGHTTFDAADLNTLIEYDENKLQPILALYKQSVEHVVHISFADETITCHKKQLFWCVNKNDWVCAKNLLSGDVLKTVEGQSIAVDAVAIIKQQAELYSLTVGPPHYLYVGKYAVLAHNMPWFVAIGIELALECGAIEFIKATVTFAVGAIALHFAKNKNKKKQKMAASLQPVYNTPFPDPNDDKNNKKDKQEHLIYESSAAHLKYQSGEKSREPQNGQMALNNSFAVGGNTMQRVSVYDGEIVVFQHTRNNIYHGYVVTWQDLNSAANKVSEAMKNILLKNNLVKGNGKII